MKRLRARLVAVLAVICLAALGSATAPALAQSDSRAPGRIVAVGGVALDNPNLVVEVLVAPRPGQSQSAAAAAALAGQGARPFTPAELSDGFGFTGLKWPQAGSGPEVAQVYNPTGEEGGVRPSFLADAQAVWNAVPHSYFSFDVTSYIDASCGSLIRECPGKQEADSTHWVGWVGLRDKFTLAVTWFDRAALDADVAMNTNFDWVGNGCAGNNGGYDALSVLIHELGHVAGLDHSTDTGSVMYTPYDGAQCALGADDVDALTLLYPELVATVSGTVTGPNGPVAGAQVRLPEIGASTSTNSDGAFSFSGVAGHLTYDLVVTAEGYQSYTGVVSVDADPTTVTTIQLTTGDSGGGGGGSGGPPACHPRFGC